MKHPLIRVGKRGEGKFRRASWDEAMNLITTGMTNIARKDGSDAIAFFSPIPSFNYVSAGAGYRLCKLMGAAGPLSFYDWYCDLPPGEPITWAFGAGGQYRFSRDLDRHVFRRHPAGRHLV